MLRMATLGGVLAWLALAGGSVARAHFIWLDFQPASAEQGRVCLYFSEEPAPGEAHLIGKVAHAKTWLRGPSGAARDVKLELPPGEEAAELVAVCKESGAASLEAVCDYGVYERGPSAMLLQYYAKCLAGDWAKHAALARAERLKLDIVPRLSADKLTLEILYDGRPVPASGVALVDPGGEHRELETDSAGRAEVPIDAGRWAIRAGHVEADASGKRDGKPYDQTWHYCTLVLNVPRSAVAPAGDVSAAEALKRARAGRAVWQNFPGFAAEVTLRGAGSESDGKLTIDAEGGVTLEVPDSPLADWAEEQLYSMVQHRMPDGEISTGDVTYADDEVDHPLGRKINLGDPDLDSVYRLRDDVITEVNRSMGKTRFTISVLEVVRNAEDKYLPRSFAMNFFDSDSGKLTGSLAYLNEWQRVGGFDLPKKILEIDAHQGGSSAKQIQFRNCRLLEAE